MLINQYRLRNLNHAGLQGTISICTYTDSVFVSASGRLISSRQSISMRLPSDSSGLARCCLRNTESALWAPDGPDIRARSSSRACPSNCLKSILVSRQINLTGYNRSALLVHFSLWRQSRWAVHPPGLMRLRVLRRMKRHGESWTPPPTGSENWKGDIYPVFLVPWSHFLVRMTFTQKCLSFLISFTSTIEYM